MGNAPSLPSPRSAGTPAGSPFCRPPPSPTDGRHTESGTPVTLDGERLPLAELVRRFSAVAARHAVGRVDIVENRVVGFKTRGIYEAPAATVLMTAHEELEAIVLDRETLHHKQAMALRYAELVYYGYWFSDLRRALDSFVAKARATPDPVRQRCCPTGPGRRPAG
ncbi:argininosuccinate synthase [Streptomyces sp. NBC_00247]|uniref:hypothetical protein n=1 Tax=Streptomyces sp. NBC_00247 TaxID=2975689 RepID=UPI002E29FA7F|nr:hypothetical protein [Streptomyces sp. NBC_00247]